MGDRIGAILFNDEKIAEARPARSDKKVMGWLGELTAMNNALSVNRGIASQPAALVKALKATERQISHDYLVILISDFYGWNEEALDCIRRIGQHNDIICSMIYDPLERDISSADKLVVSDGHYQLELDPGHNDLGARYEASFESSFARVRSDLIRHQIPVIPVSTAVPAAQQLREQLGGQRVIV